MIRAFNEENGRVHLSVVIERDRFRKIITTVFFINQSGNLCLIDSGCIPRDFQRANIAEEEVKQMLGPTRCTYFLPNGKCNGIPGVDCDPARECAKNQKSKSV